MLKTEHERRQNIIILCCTLVLPQNWNERRALHSRKNYLKHKYINKHYTYERAEYDFKEDSENGMKTKPGYESYLVKW